MATFGTWLKASRPQTLPLSLSGPLIGIFYVLPASSINWCVATLTLLTALGLQLISNYANDLGDYKKGADVDRTGAPERMLSSGKITLPHMKRALIITGIFTFLSGSALLLVSWEKIGIPALIVLFIIGLLSIYAAVAYTATKNAYGYRALGDLAVFLFFGIVSVAGSAYLQAGTLTIDIIYPVVALGLLSAGVLNLNNIRDYHRDKAANKRTLVVVLGREGGVSYHYSLVFIGALAWSVSYIRDFQITWMLLVGIISLTISLMVHIILVSAWLEGKQVNTLKNLSLTVFLNAILFVALRIIAT